MSQAGPTLRIADVSDIHVGAHDEPTLARLADSLHAAGVAATVLTGDLTMRARTAQFARAKQVFDQFPTPTTVVLGNHDLPLTNPVRRLSSPYTRYRTPVTDELYPVLDLAGARIQGLGSMPRWRWKSGRISDRQAGAARARSGVDADPHGTAGVQLEQACSTPASRGTCGSGRRPGDRGTGGPPWRCRSSG